MAFRSLHHHHQRLKDFAEIFNGVVLFSPALTDAVELRWVNEQNENGSEGWDGFPVQERCANPGLMDLNLWILRPSDDMLRAVSLIPIP